MHRHSERLVSRLSPVWPQGGLHLKTLAMAVLTLVLLVGLTPTTSVDAGNLPGLVSRWSAEGNANDSVGTNNGTLMNGATFAPGKVGRAFSFDGVNDFVSFGNTVGNFGTSDFSLDFWIKTTITGKDVGIIGKRPVCNHSSFWDIRLTKDGKLSIELDQDSAQTNYITLGTTRAVNDGNFHHVALTRQGTTISVYIDGLLDVTLSKLVANIVNSANLAAGKSTCTGLDGTIYLNGLLDEIEIYNRALSASEIQGIYLVPNGDFEIPNAGAGFVTYGAGQTFGGWTVETGAVDHVGALWKAASGLQSVDLNGNTAGSIYRDLSTTPGQSYVLRFAMAGNPGGAPALKQMEVLWGGVSVDKPTFDVTGRSFSSMGWVERQYTVMATSSVTRLTFRTVIPGVYGPAVDNVRVEPLTQVVNTPPVATVSLNTNSPRTNDVLTATATKSDPDSSPVQLTFVWKKNGTVMKTTPNTGALTDTYVLSTPGNGDKNDIIVVEVTPNDGTVNGATVTAQAKVANTPPSVSVDLNSLSPKTNDVLTATATKSDADNDPVTLTFVWKVKGIERKATLDSAALTDTFNLSQPGFGDKNDTITVDVTAGDGIDKGAAAPAQATVINTPPVLKTLVLTPVSGTAPRTNDILTTTATTQDDDGDTVVLSYVWKKNGAITAGATGPTYNLSVAGNGDKNDTITVEATPGDGTDNGASVSTQATVKNTPPVATVGLFTTNPWDKAKAQVPVSPTSTRTNDLLTATATKSDADNDPVTLTFVWKKNGAVMKTTVAPTSLTDTYDLKVPGNGDKNDTITVEVTPKDNPDNEAGATVSAQTVIVNTPPVAKFLFTINRTSAGAIKPPMEGARTQFKDLSYDIDPGDTVVSWNWNFKGPAAGPNVNKINLASTMQSPYFFPPDNGLYTVTLTVAGSDATTNTATSGSAAADGSPVQKLLVANTPPKVNALNVEVRTGADVMLIGRFLDHGWLDTHTATWTVDGVSGPIPATVMESHKARLGTGLVTGVVPGASISNALAALGKTVPATLNGTLRVTDTTPWRTGFQTYREDKFIITVVANDPNSREPNNDFSLAPRVLLTDWVYTSYIQSTGDIDIFEVKRPVGALPVGSEVLVTLKGLPADYDVALLTQLPPGAAPPGGQSQFGSASFDVNNFKISGFDDSGFDDSGFDDSGFDDSGFDDSGFDDSGFDDSGFDDSGFDDSGFDDSGFDDSGFDDSGFDDSGFDDSGFDDSSLSAMSFTGVSGSNIGGTDLQLSELGLGGILTSDIAPYLKVAGFSANRGQKEETLLTRIAIPGTRLYVVVLGSNSARSANPYLLQIESSAPKVKLPVGQPLVSPPAPQTNLRVDSAPQTLFVTQRERLTALYNMDATAWNNFQSKLVALAAHSAVRGDILSLPSGIYDNWDTNPWNVDEANNTAAAIRNIVQPYLASHPTIQYVVLVGSDDLVPYRRSPDETVISNERYYLRSSYLKLGSPLFSSVLLGYNLTDDYYVSAKPMAWQGRDLYIPDLPVGRLVETPAEIMATADRFLSVNGLLTPRTALVTGYEGFSDGAQTMAANLSAGGLATTSLIGTTWSAADLRAKLLGQASPDISAANAHFTHYAALSALGFTNKQSDFMSSVDVSKAIDVLVGRLLLSIGCHSGLNVPDRGSRAADPGLGINPALDFAQAVGQQRAVYVASTGYGLFETDGLGGTELLLTILSKALVQGDVSIGNALVGAKQQYLGGISPMTVYDEKSSIQTTLYGLPMYRIQVPAPPPAAAPSGGSNTLTIVDGGSTTTIGYSLEPVVTANGTYYRANGDAQATAGRPIEPRITRPIAADAAWGPVHGILLTGGSFSDTPGFNPVIDRPTNEWERNVTEPQTPLASFWPAQPATVNGLVTAKGLVQTLVVTPGQFKATSALGAPVTGIQRLYSSLGLELLRSTSSDWQPPVIRSVDFRAVNDTTVTVTVDASDPSGIARIVVLRLSNGSFVPTSLLTTGTGPFTLNVPFSNGDTMLIEVVDGAGNVASATGKGATFSVIKVDASVIQVHRPGSPVTFQGVISGFGDLPKPVLYNLDFGDGTFADGQVNSATFTVQHQYDGSLKQATATLKVTDVGGGVGVDKVLLFFDRASDVGTVTADADLTGGAAWIDSKTMTIVLGVKGAVSPDFQYRVRIDTDNDGAQDLLLRYDDGKATGLPGLTATAAGNQVTFTFKLVDAGLRSGDTIQLSAEVQGGVKAAKGVGIADKMPDNGLVSYGLY